MTKLLTLIVWCTLLAFVSGCGNKLEADPVVALNNFHATGNNTGGDINFGKYAGGGREATYIAMACVIALSSITRSAIKQRKHEAEKTLIKNSVGILAEAIQEGKAQAAKVEDPKAKAAVKVITKRVDYLAANTPERQVIDNILDEKGYRSGE